MGGSDWSAAAQPSAQRAPFLPASPSPAVILVVCPATLFYCSAAGCLLFCLSFTTLACHLCHRRTCTLRLLATFAFILLFLPSACLLPASLLPLVRTVVMCGDRYAFYATYLPARTTSFVAFSIGSAPALPPSTHQTLRDVGRSVGGWLNADP